MSIILPMLVSGVGNFTSERLITGCNIDGESFNSLLSYCVRCNGESSSFNMHTYWIYIIYIKIKIRIITILIFMFFFCTNLRYVNMMNDLNSYGIRITSNNNESIMLHKC